MSHAKLLAGCCTFLVVVICHTSALSQVLDRQGKSPWSGTVGLGAGLPASAPIRKFKLRDFYSATISSPFETIGAVMFIMGTDTLGKGRFWLIIRRMESTIEASTISFPDSSIDTICSVEHLNPDPTAEVRFSLKLCLVQSSKTLVYQWMVDSIQASPIKLGSPMPGIAALSLNGEQIHIPAHDSVVVVNWWALWCTPCVEEIPALNRLVDEFKSRRVSFVAITPDNANDVRGFLKQKNFRYIIATVSEAAQTSLGHKYPRNIVLGRNGKLIFDQVGGTANIYEQLRSEIQGALIDSLR